MKISPVLAMLIAVPTVGMPAAGQTHAALSDIDAPVLEDVQPPLPADDASQHASLPSPTPPVRVARQGERIEPRSPADEYRTAIKALAIPRHQFVHCRLQNGKILTGLIRDVNDQGFSLHTNAIGGTYIHYTKLAESPRSVPAV